MDDYPPPLDMRLDELPGFARVRAEMAKWELRRSVDPDGSLAAIARMLKQKRGCRRGRPATG